MPRPLPILASTMRSPSEGAHAISADVSESGDRGHGCGFSRHSTVLRIPDDGGLDADRAVIG